MNDFELSDSMMCPFQNDLIKLCEQHCLGDATDTADNILATYLLSCLINFNRALKYRDAYNNQFKEIQS